MHAATVCEMLVASFVCARQVRHDKAGLREPLAREETDRREAECEGDREVLLARGVANLEYGATVGLVRYFRALRQVIGLTM